MFVIRDTVLRARAASRSVLSRNSKPVDNSSLITHHSSLSFLWRYGWWIGIGVVTLAAFALRVWTVRQSLPYVDHPDEPNPIGYVVQMLRTGDPDQHAFQKPSLYVYLLLAVLSAHVRWAVTTGVYANFDQMHITTHTVTTIPGFFLWARTFTALVGGLTVLSAFALGARGWSRAAGLIGALFVATLPFHVQFSRYVTTDVTSAWFVLLALSAALVLVQTGRWRAYLVAGAFAGFAASTKYNAGIVAFAIAGAHVVYWGRRSFVRLPLLVGAGGAALLAFLVGTPYVLLNWSEVQTGLLYQWTAYQAGTQGALVGAWNVNGYRSFLWDEGLLPPACIATLVGLVLLLWKRPKVGLVWLSFVVPSLLIHLAMPTHYMQNLMPVIVVCALPVGVAGAEAIGWLMRRVPRYGAIGAVALLAVLLLPATLDTWRTTWQQHAGDTRVHAIDWIAANVPPGTRIAAEVKPVPAANGEDRWVDIDQLTKHDLQWYRHQGYAYLIASSKRWGQLQLPDSYVQLTQSAPLAEFGSYQPGTMLGPHLFIYATGLSQADVSDQTLGDAHFSGARLLGLAMGRNKDGALQLGSDGQSRRSFRAGDTLGLRTFWQVEQPLGADYFVFIHLLDANGTTVVQRDAPPWLGRFPTSSWRAGTLVVDTNDLPLPANLPPGDYTLIIGMFDPANGARPPVLLNGQPQASGEISLGAITVTQ